MTRRISVLGSTGSIGLSTLDLLERAQPGEFKVVGLSANRNVSRLARQAIQFDADCVAIADETCAAELKSALSGHDIDILSGPDGVTEMAERPVDITMAAIVGAAGLPPTLAAVSQGNTVALANKECLVCAGATFMTAVKRHKTTLLPVDSEHNAIFQVLDRDRPAGVRRLILTASGGPFRETSLDDLQRVTREDALAHPVWSMGSKISIDSATLMNKGLELIEAAWLFDRPSHEIDVVIHPQSVIHSMVEYVDGSVLSQMGSPDMRTPIAYALGWPNRMETPVAPLNFPELGALTFFKPDLVRFPALRLAREALEAGGQAACVLNAANEVAVEAFLQGRIAFLDIAKTCELALEKLSAESDFACSSGAMQSVMHFDGLARAAANEHIVNL
ncbi:1-deoxy-D-xylulose-5-phosphate reductoisomerase [Algimonas porphyrae]|uniref:1-deoxy-D-xylulose 5-phosphate reductoisomerase n=1 Tax=Algimonas porphyrae TaxID=1128113 RepID=A0ABQ5UYD3_9PROT|nr:1-deoxy-D-xylulose-5-phosphate reductoisomerase [Algimonas porphyrae]GLQ20291.1 1-deoxy-D-xylulose 5-phosphate reductoisomerase [Algimonas porphyrae]